MYSGTTFNKQSGRVMGAHQRIDRLAMRSLNLYVGKGFPSIREVLHFEGKNGPDGIKRKSPAKDEPWHYIDPRDAQSAELLDVIDDHIFNLSAALGEKNNERAAFEAAWLAHAITDGLTPAHHYPLEEKLVEMRGEGIETRTSTKEKLVLPGDTRRDQLRNNWQYWGTKGIMTTHLGFEFGVATAMASFKLKLSEPNHRQFTLLEQKGYREIFLQTLSQIDSLNMYTEFAQKGWTTNLASQTRTMLIPRIVEAVMLGWYVAAKEAGLTT